MPVLQQTAVPTSSNLPDGFKPVQDAPAGQPLARDDKGNYWQVHPITNSVEPLVKLVEDASTRLPDPELRLLNGAAILQRLRVTLDHMAQANTPFNQAQLVIIGMLQNTMTYRVNAAMVWHVYVMGLGLNPDSMAAYYARQLFVRAWNVTAQMLGVASQSSKPTGEE